MKTTYFLHNLLEKERIARKLKIREKHTKRNFLAEKNKINLPFEYSKSAWQKLNRLSKDTSEDIVNLNLKLLERLNKIKIEEFKELLSLDRDVKVSFEEDFLIFTSKVHFSPELNQIVSLSSGKFKTFSSEIRYSISKDQFIFPSIIAFSNKEENYAFNQALELLILSEIKVFRKAVSEILNKTYLECNQFSSVESFNEEDCYKIYNKNSSRYNVSISSGIKDILTIHNFTVSKDESGGSLFAHGLYNLYEKLSVYTFEFQNPLRFDLSKTPYFSSFKLKILFDNKKI